MTKLQYYWLINHEFAFAGLIFLINIFFICHADNLNFRKIVFHFK